MSPFDQAIKSSLEALGRKMDLSRRYAVGPWDQEFVIPIPASAILDKPSSLEYVDNLEIAQFSEDLAGAVFARLDSL